jgi:hypothetical protein
LNSRRAGFRVRREARRLRLSARSSSASRFCLARPSIEIEGLINPNLRMQAWASEPMNVEAVTELWRNVVCQVLDQGLALATRLELETT